MADCRLKIKVVDWEDRPFVVALDGALTEALCDGTDVDGEQVAARVESALHAAGYPRSHIDYRRSAPEVLMRVAHWTVWRGEPAAGPGG